MNRTLETQLREFYKTWCADNELPLYSAEELLAGDDETTQEQRDWLAAFIPLWNLTLAFEDRAMLAMRAPDAPEEVEADAPEGTE